MDKTLFANDAPGQLIATTTLKGRDWAFVPDRMPPKWTFPLEMWPLLDEAKCALATLNGIGQTLPDPQLLLRPLQRREALASSRIEGTYVTPAQLLLYELGPAEQDSSDDPDLKSWREVINYNSALAHGWKEMESLSLMNRVIKEMHAILMKDVRGSEWRPGDFRQAQVQIESTARFVPPPHSYVLDLMSDLEKFINTDTKDFDPLVRCFIAHYQFETIHPFMDGNGRVGRALLALMICRDLGHTMPWVYMSNFYDQFNDEYKKALFNVSARGEWTEWVEFCLRGATFQANDAIRRCHLFREAKNDFHQAIKNPSKRTHQLIDHLFVSPIVTVPSVKDEFRVNYKTAKADIDRLVHYGVLRRMNNPRRPAAFCCQRIMDIAYTEVTQPEKEEN